MATHTELYDLLGVDPGSTEKEIKSAYRKQSKKHHPDVGGDPERFKNISEAYQILIDPKKRKCYDQHGHANIVTFETKFNALMDEVILPNIQNMRRTKGIDVISDIRTAIDHCKKEMNRLIKSMERELDNLQDFLDNLEVEEGANRIIFDRTGIRIDMLKNQIQLHRGQLKFYDDCFEVVGSYKSKNVDDPLKLKKVVITDKGLEDILMDWNSITGGEDGSKR